MNSEAKRNAMLKAFNHMFMWGGTQIVWKKTCEVVDPISDLNVLHDCELSLTPKEHALFRTTLRNVCSHPDDPLGTRSLPSAGAEQRTEAILRVKNLWEH